MGKRERIEKVTGALALPVLIFFAAMAVAPACALEDTGRARAVSCEKESIILEREGNIDKAIEVIREGIRADAAYTPSYIRLGYLLLKKGSPDEALQAFDEALRRIPESHDAKTGKGIAFARKGDFKAAESLLRGALVLNPDPLRTHYELGLVYEKMGDMTKALAEYRAGIDKYRQGRK